MSSPTPASGWIARRMTAKAPSLSMLRTMSFSRVSARTVNKVYRAESAGVCSTEFHVMRVRLAPDGAPRVIPDYLAAVLRSGIVLSQTRHMMTGNTHPRLTNDDVVNLVVPVPDHATQQRIAAEVSRRRDAARRLREEAGQLWDNADRRSEETLLGPAE